MIRRLFTAGTIFAAAAATTVGFGSTAASAAPACAGTVGTLIPSPSPTGWAENAVYGGAGNLWITRNSASMVQRYDRLLHLTATVPVEPPGAIRLGPRGALYVISGNATTNAVPGARRTGTVLSSDPKSPHPVARIFARGLGMPDGLAFDADGYGYVSDSALGVIRLRPDGSIDRSWSAAAPKNYAPTATVNGSGINGAAITGDTLYVTLTASLTGRVLALPLAHPDRGHIAADLTAPLPGSLDDLVTLDDSTLAVATPLGDVYLVNVHTGTRCVVEIGAPATAVAVSPRGAGDLVVTSETGTVYSVTLRR